MPLTEFDAGSGQALATDDDAAPAAAAAAAGTLQAFDRIPLARIVPSLTNPRKTFDQAKLQELAESIRGLGVMQPILVRPLPGARVAETSMGLRKGAPRPEYEIVSGERRYRASELAGVPDIPAMIRALSDQQVLEAQLVENLQRDDLHPLEEAEGYQRLCDATGIRKDEIAAKIGKSRTYVYNRLKLLDLVQESRDAFRTGSLDTSRAELLATVADPKLQLKALKEFSAVGYKDRRMSVRECSGWLADNILLKIKDAPFDTKDEALVAGCGACSSCPKRTHADRDLFASFDGPDMCTDPPCYRAKEKAHLDAIKADAEAKGMEVIAGAEAKKLAERWGDGIKGYTRLDQKRADIDPENEPTVGKLLGKDAPKPILFIHPTTQQKIRVLPTEVVEQALKAKGLVTTTKAERSKAQAAAEAREKAKAAIDAAYQARALATVLDALRTGGVDHFSAQVLRLHLVNLLADRNGYRSDDLDRALLTAWGLPVPTEGESWEQARKMGEAVDAHVQAAPDGALGVMLMQFLVADDVTKAEWLNDGKQPLLEQVAGECGVDLAQIRKEVQAEHKAAGKPTKSEAAPPGATSKAAPQGSIAQDDAAGVEAAGGGKRTGGRRRKLSEREAKSGIADAMQSIDEPGGAKDSAAGDVALGDKVRVLKRVRGAKGMAGREGTVIRVNLSDDHPYDVEFGPGEVFEMKRGEFELVPAPAEAEA